MPSLALVTGGTRGIGKAISLALKGAGYKVIANYVKDDKSAKAFSEEYSIPVKKWNVGDYEACVRAVSEIEKESGVGIGILVNNAGVVKDRFFHKTSPEDWREVIDTNLMSCFNLSRAVINGMRERNYGRIVNISSVNALTGRNGQTNYCASKAGILGFTKALARESISKNVTVNAVAPGYVTTDMVKNTPKEILNEIISSVPAGRLGRPEEIASAVLFLCRENSGFITGETISVNGGQNML